MLDCHPNQRATGFGLVIDTATGLVVVSRAIVPHDLCDITINIADSTIVEGKAIFLHLLQGYAIVQYDSNLACASVKSARLSEKMVNQGEGLLATTTAAVVQEGAAAAARI
jgi:pro-apoptotic serine protease NMA111